MDPSMNRNLNGSHLQRDNNPAPYGTMIEGIHNYANPENGSGGNDEYNFATFDPALFEDGNVSHGFSNQSQHFQPNYNSNISRQNNSPALPQYHSPQGHYVNNQYNQPIYEPRPPAQALPIDPRYYSRPSPSPLSYESYMYQPQIGYANQNLNSQHLAIQPRPSSTPQQNYPPNQAQPSPYINFAQRPAHLDHVQNPDMIHYPNYPEHSQQASHHFVDPSMLTANQMPGVTGNNGNYSGHENYQQSPYYSKTGGILNFSSIAPGQPPQSVSPNGQLSNPAGAPVPSKPNKVSNPKKPKDPNAPKRPKTKVDKVGTAVKQIGDASVSESESEALSIVDEEPPEPTPTLLMVSAPTDERGKALYNAVQAVWTPRNKLAPPEKVRTGIATFGDTVRSLRDAWKTKNDNLKKAELPNSATSSQVPSLKNDVAHYRQVTESVMSRSLQFGHPSVIKRLGENQFTMSALYSFLLDRFTAGDYDSTLVSSILKFVVEFETLDEEMLEMTKWSKILQRFTKKATNDSKGFAQTILNNAIAATSRKNAEAKNVALSSPKEINGAPDQTSKESLGGVKRSRDGEPLNLPATKKTLVKPIVKSSKPLALQNAERRRAEEAAQAAKVEKTLTTSTTAPAATKGKIAVAAPPKMAVFSSLMSASKKPGTSIAARAAAAKEKANNVLSTSDPVISQLKTEVKRDSPPRNVGITVPAKTPASSFLGFLADMDKKEEVRPKKEDDIPEETDEQKQRRLRKEARKRLRVSWKPDAELVDVRHFTHDPNEEIGHADSMMQDAGDTVKEGEMLKLHKGLDDLDDEDEDEAFQDFQSYKFPSEVDFGDLGEDVAVNSEKFGGPVKPVSPSSEAQEKHEQNSVMAVYASKSDRPTSPKEPDDNGDDGDDGDFQPCADFGEPEHKTREREKKAFAAHNPAVPNSGAAGFDLAAQLQALKGAQTTQQQPGSIPTDLQRTLSILGQTNQSAPQAVAASPSGLDLQQLMATVQQVKQQLQSQQQYQAPPQQAAPQNNNLSALLAQIQQTSHSLPTGHSGNPNPYPGTDDFTRKHSRNDSNNDYDIDQRRSSNKKKKSGEKIDGSKPYNYKTQACSFWKEGKCLKGDNCTYRHDDD